MTQDATELGKAEEDARREKGKEAFFSGRYREAYSHSHSALLSKAIRWFREEGVAFHRPPAEFTPLSVVFSAVALGADFLVTSDLRMGAGNGLTFGHRALLHPAD